MRRLTFGIALLAFVVLRSVSMAQESAPNTVPPAKPTMKLVVPDEVKYGPLPPELVSGTPSVETSGTLEVAVLAGDPAKPGAYTILAHCSDGYKIAPHWHPGTENLVVLQGGLGVGMGWKWDSKALKTAPTHSFASIPGGMRHFAQCNGDTVMQIYGTGTFKLNFVSAPPATAKKAPAKKAGGK
jgi:hypothetical protein